jgi:hypothetical protein
MFQLYVVLKSLCDFTPDVRRGNKSCDINQRKLCKCINFLPDDNGVPGVVFPYEEIDT